MKLMRWVVASVFLILLAACSPDTPNPSFPVSYEQACLELKTLKAHPKTLNRPLIIVGGYLDFGIAAAVMPGRFGELTGDSRIHGVTIGFSSSFDGCREKIIKTVDQLYPTDDPEKTVEVDVIGVSMGGLAARYAAMPSGSNRRLNIARLFTISSPLNGAVRAKWPTWNRLQIDMRPGSEFLKLVNAETHLPYPMYCYVRLSDLVVGTENAAPPGKVAWWVSNRSLESAHIGAMTDPRILTDIARRLRDEPPFTAYPPAALPK